MYDYATVTKQNQIITQTEVINDNIETLIEKIDNTNNAIGVLQVLCCLVLISTLILRCMGDRRK